jgi:hypothetical protein
MEGADWNGSERKSLKLLFYQWEENAIDGT